MQAAHAEIAGNYYLNEQSFSVEETSALMDDFGWKCGWRISDNAEKTLLNAGFDAAGFFVIDTHTMKIYASGPTIGYDAALKAAKEIDALYP